MEKFERGLRQVSGRNFGYVRPLAAVADDDWVKLFEADLKDSRLDEFFLLVDLVGAEERCVGGGKS